MSWNVALAKAGQAPPRSIGSRAIALALETPNNTINYVTIKQEKLLRNSKPITL